MEHFLLLVPGPLPGCIFMRHIILALFTVCDHVGVTTVERSDPKALSTFSQCTEFPQHTGLKLNQVERSLGSGLSTRVKFQRVGVKIA